MPDVGDILLVLTTYSHSAMVFFEAFAFEPMIASPLLSTFAPLHTFFTSDTILPRPEPSWGLMTRTVFPLKSSFVSAVSISGA